MIKNKFDIGDFVNVLTKQRAISELTLRSKKRRKEAGLTQRELAQKAGVTYSAVRRFELSGEIAFVSLVSICEALGALEDINKLLENPIITSVRDYKND